MKFALLRLYGIDNDTAEAIIRGHDDYIYLRLEPRMPSSFVRGSDWRLTLGIEIRVWAYD